MTSYSYHLRFSDGEALALAEALTRHICYCEDNLRAGLRAPFWAQKRHCEKASQRHRSRADAEEHELVLGEGASERLEFVSLTP